jgi:uncharacterized protein
MIPQPNQPELQKLHHVHVAEPVTSRRLLWERGRALMEASSLNHTPIGIRSREGDRLFDRFLAVVSWGLKMLGLYRRGVRNALDIRLKTIELTFPDLPRAFDGYRILHLTDLHLDSLPGLARTVVASVAGAKANLCVLTGDYRAADDGPFDAVLGPMAELLSAVPTTDGVVGTLGNHDDHLMGRAFEDMGITMLHNERLALERGEDRVILTGIDDVHRFYTPVADEALRGSVDGFAIALVHSPEMAEEAAAAGHALYLCGHTHGGQICLPGGRPLVTHLTRNRALASGLWRCGKMIGYTGPGVGVSGLPVRYFTRGEATLFILKSDCRHPLSSRST